jgi:hypothetical protein
MLGFEEGIAEVKEYYAKALEIVKMISTKPDALEIYRRIFEQIAIPCVKLINQGHLELARLTYKKHSISSLLRTVSRPMKAYLFSRTFLYQ